MEFSSRSDREAFWRSLMERRETLRLPVKQVCDEAGVSSASYFQWQRKLRGAKPAREQEGTSFAPLVPVRIVDDRLAEVTLEFPNGLRLLHPQRCDEVSLQRVVRVAMAVSRGPESC